MKRKLAIGFVFLACISLYILQYQKVNRRYLNPLNIDIYENETIRIDDIDITPLKAEFINEEKIRKLYPQLINNNESYNSNPIGLYLMKISCNNNTDEKKNLDFTQWMIEADAWGNGINGIFFSTLNPDISITQKLNAHEKIVVQLPFTMVKNMFTKKQWKELKSRNFNIVVSLYPQKIILKSGNRYR